MKFQNCFYYNKERHCESTDYNILSDSVVSVDSVLSSYKKLAEDNFKVQLFQKDHYIIGRVKSLIPFSKSGMFIGVNLKWDTLWITTYGKKIKFELPKTNVRGKLYTKDKLDRIPSYDGDSTLQDLGINYDAPFCCDDDPPYYLFIYFTVTKNSKIVNINSGTATEKESKEIAIALSKFKNIKPRTRKGKAVDSEMHYPFKLIYD